MAVAGGPDIVESGLVLCLDAGNSRSYPGSGTAWTDLSGNGNTGTLVNGTGYATSNGGVLTFDATNDRISVPDANSLDFSGNFTIEVWVYANTLHNSGIVSKRYAPDVGTGTWILGHTSGGSFAWSNIDPTVYPNRDKNFGSYTANTWKHILITRNSGVISFYVDGIVATTSNDSLNFTSTQTVMFGAWASTQVNWSSGLVYPFNGRLGVCRMYKDKGFSREEVLQNFNALRGRYGL